MAQGAVETVSQHVAESATPPPPHPPFNTSSFGNEIQVSNCHPGLETKPTIHEEIVTLSEVMLLAKDISPCTMSINLKKQAHHHPQA
jgi:hypothetical protein